MDRQKLIEIAFQKGRELHLNNERYLSWLASFFDEEYSNDVGDGDLTSEALLPKSEQRTAVLKAKASGVIGGLEEVSWFLRKRGLAVRAAKKDGEEVLSGETVLQVHGKQKSILATERIALNIMQRMSGIATETRHLTSMIRRYATRIAATRKTPLRYLDKKAVFLGGGLTHRFGLWDSILIKDNHLEVLRNQSAKDYVEVALARASLFTEKVGFIEIETESHEEALRAAKRFYALNLKKPCVVMLDNMKPKAILKVIETLQEEGVYDSVLLEASGKITSRNIEEYAKTGIDVVSLGYLTHSARVLDMSLEMLL